MRCLAGFRVLWACVDFVLGDYCDHGDVVCVDVCGCCAHDNCGDLSMPRKCEVMCMCSLADAWWMLDVVLVVFNVVLAIVIVLKW